MGFQSTILTLEWVIGLNNVASATPHAAGAGGGTDSFFAMPVCGEFSRGSQGKWRFTKRVPPRVKPNTTMATLAGWRKSHRNQALKTADFGGEDN